MSDAIIKVYASRDWVEDAIGKLSSETVKSVVLEGNELDLVHWEHGLGMFEVSSGNGKNIKATLRKTNDDGEIVDVGANFYLKKIHFIVINDQHDQNSDGGYYHQVDMTSLDDFCHYCDSVYSDGTSETWYGERNLCLKGPNLHTQTKLIEYAINEVHDELDKVAKIATDEYINSLIDSQNVELDTTLTVAGQAADAKAVGDALKNLSVSGLTTAQVNALDGMFKVAAYDDSKDVSGAYAAFRAAFGLGDAGGEEPDTPVEPDEPETKTYIITNELVNVTSSNSATSITEGASYTATLTAAEGYELDTVSVLMGGVNVTADVYADGVISIASVTGNLEIVASASVAETEAVLPNAGLLSYWDLRNAATGSSSNPWYPSIGNTETMRLKPSYEPACDGYGALLNNDTYGGATVQKMGDDGAWADMNYGTEFTIVTMCYGGFVAPEKYYALDGYKAFFPKPTYVKTDGTTTVGTQKQNIANKLGAAEYATIIVRVNENLLDIFYNGEVAQSANGSDYDGFNYWVNSGLTIRSIKSQASGHLTALAVYDKALTDAEIVELCAYLKTLEVTA